MEEEVLFTITKEHLDTGLRGFPVGYCTTSHVDPQKGLFYRGTSILKLSTWEPVKVIYLLYYGKEGTHSEITAFEKELIKRAHLEEKVIRYILALPKEGHPMDLFASAIQIVGMFEKNLDYRENSLTLIATLPHIAALVINHHGGFGKTPPSQPELGYMENFVRLLTIPSSDKLIQVMRLFNILHYDHGGGNLSTFVGKAVGSGLQHMYGAISAAMNALAGPKHGRANQDCLEFVEMALSDLGEKATIVEVEKYIRKRLNDNKLIFGFGHAVLRVEDPRATIFYDYAKKYFPTHPLVSIALHLRTAGEKVLAENPKVSDPHANIDAISGTVLAAAGFHYPEYFTLLFGLARAVGIAIQIVYDRLEAREGKGTPIVRPKYLYKAAK